MTLVIKKIFLLCFSGSNKWKEIGKGGTGKGNRKDQVRTELSAQRMNVALDPLK